jgi:GMP synthase (glutamine-hydrolysing)
VEPSLAGYEGLIVLGGPMNVEQTKAFPHLLHELKLIDQALKKKIPILGICLGAQLITKALGARVYDNKQKEIGWHDVSLTDAGTKDQVFQHFNATERLFHWHSQTFGIPVGASHLAFSALCTNQAFRYGENVYGLQFHLEVDEKIIKRWLSVPANQEDLIGMINPTEILVETPKNIARLHQLSNLTFTQFIRLFDTHQKCIRLPSR